MPFITRLFENEVSCKRPDGHISLVRRARSLADITVVSIFVNPTQFGPAEDFDSYPRDFIRDCDLLKDIQVDVIFAPEEKTLYPEGYATYVGVEGITTLLCGASRPVHFRGVTTVVSKLFNIVQPDFAIFGQKDYQQSVVIRRMVKDLNIPVEIVICPIVRESDGLALSSRNTYLSDEDRSVAPAIYKALKEAETLVEEGERSTEKIIRTIEERFGEEPRLTIDYVEIVDPETLESLKEITDKAVIAVALFLGETRLIDNIIVSAGGPS